MGEKLMRNPVQRAKEAQIAFAALVISGPNQITSARMTEALLLIVSTAEASGKNSRGIEVNHGHRNISERDPALFETLNKDVWASLMKSYPLGGVWPTVEYFLRRHLRFSTLSVDEVYAAAQELRHAA